ERHMKQAKYFIGAMDCPTEEQIIRNGLKNHPSVERLDFDLMNRVLSVTLTPQGEAAAVEAALDGLGMAADPVGTDPGRQAKGAAPSRQRWLIMGAAGLLAAAAEGAAWATGEERSLTVIAPSVLSLLLGGRDTFRKGWTALRTLTLNINFLMTLAVVG